MLSILVLKILFPFFVLAIGGVLAVIFFILTFQKKSSHQHEDEHSHDSHH